MKVKRIAHRGFSSEAPENTYPSFALAVEGDFFGVECDIWKSRDGVYVVSHDGHLRRMCGVDRWIPETDYGEICRYPVIAGKNREGHPPQHLICFTDYLALLRRRETIQPIVELKMDFTTVELEKIVDLVKKYGLYDRTYFISMHFLVLLRLRDMGVPAEHLQYVYGAVAGNKWTKVSPELERWLIENRISLDARYTLVDAAVTEHLHREGLSVNVWTVNDRKEMERMVNEIGVDMVTTEFYYDI